jgi:hypothetical protein
LKPAWANSLRNPVLKKLIKKREQVEWLKVLTLRVQEFKSQYCKKKKKKERKKENIPEKKNDLQMQVAVQGSQKESHFWLHLGNTFDTRWHELNSFQRFGLTMPAHS